MSLESAMNAEGVTATVDPNTSVSATPAAAPGAESKATEADAALAALTGKKPVEPKEEALSPKFAALVKKERGLVKMRQELAAEKAELERIRAELHTEREKISQKPTDPLQALMMHGYTYEQATEFLLNNKKPTPEHEIKSVRDEIKALKEEQEKKEREAAERSAAQAKEQEERVIAGFKEEIAEFVLANPEKYELTQLYGQESLVFDTIEAHFQKTGKIMSKEEAADAVERYLEGENERILSSSKKIQAKLGAKAQPKPEEKGATSTQSGATLHNGMSSSAPSFLPAKSEQDRIQRALAKLG